MHVIYAHVYVCMLHVYIPHETVIASSIADTTQQGRIWVLATHKVSSKFPVVGVRDRNDSGIKGVI